MYNINKNKTCQMPYRKRTTNYMSSFNNGINNILYLKENYLVCI